mmetsp:Transcript_12799/g.28758  ORF Transcript_12799/g.28758 Transcript_12799/m.28758 type:complete len:860 (-) Transcript_12799:8-2587(-)
MAEHRPLLGAGSGGRGGGMRAGLVSRVVAACAAVAVVTVVALSSRGALQPTVLSGLKLRTHTQTLLYKDWRGMSLEAVDAFSFSHTWEGSVNVGEREQHVVQMPDLSLAPTGAPSSQPLPADSDVAQSLTAKYGITLAGTWETSEAAALLQTFNALCDGTDEITGTPQENCGLKDIYTAVRVSPGALSDDVAVEDGKVAIAKAAFRLAGARAATLAGVKGTVGSHRLEFALVKALTAFGRDKAVVGQLLQRKFAATLDVQGKDRPGFIELTKPTTLEDSQRFQAFKSPELVFMLEAWSLMPEHMHKVDGLRYVTRRQQGLYHPMYGATTAVSWPENQETSYQEYMDYSFNQDGYTARHLFIHEKSHFFWAKQFDTELKEGWQSAGKWEQEKQSYGSWMTSRTTSFSSDYGASNNPDEDMAECISAYVLHPTTLQARSPGKDKFLADKVFEGVRYVEQPELTFSVANEEPYLRYPAAVKHVAITCTGSPAEDKDVKIEMLVDVGQGWHSPSTAEISLAGPTSGSKTVTLTPEANEAGEEIGEDAEEGKGRVVKMVYSGKFSKHFEKGFWSASQIKVMDKLGHERWIRIDDYSWRLYLNNKEGTAWAPRYIKESLQLKVTAGTDEATGEDHPIVTATMRFEQTGAPLSDDKPVWMRLASKELLPEELGPRPASEDKEAASSSDEGGTETRRLLSEAQALSEGTADEAGGLLDQENWMAKGSSEFAYPVYQTGKCVKDENSYRGTCTVSWKLSNRAPAGVYYVSMMNLADEAGNTRRQFFTQQREGWTCCGRVGNTPDDEFPVAVALKQCPEGGSGRLCVDSDADAPELDRASLAAKFVPHARGRGEGEAVVTFKARDAGML